MWPRTFESVNKTLEYVTIKTESERAGLSSVTNCYAVHRVPPWLKPKRVTLQMKAME